jgi:hypothetical protein
VRQNHLLKLRVLAGFNNESFDRGVSLPSGRLLHFLRVRRGLNGPTAPSANDDSASFPLNTDCFDIAQPQSLAGRFPEFQTGKRWKIFPQSPE